MCGGRGKRPRGNLVAPILFIHTVGSAHINKYNKNNKNNKFLVVHTLVHLIDTLQWCALHTHTQRDKYKNIYMKIWTEMGGGGS